MIINKHPYVGKILRAFSNEITDDSYGYKVLLTVTCDVTTKSDDKGNIYKYTHEVWFWNDAVVEFKGQSMTWKEYLKLNDRIPIKEGFYFESEFMDKKISGEIKIYSPSTLGVMLGVDTNSK